MLYTQAASGGFSSIVVIIAIGLLFYGVIIALIVLAIRALRKYLRGDGARRESYELRRSLGEVLKAHRTRCRMTQEFVAESLGVSRQAVSKWETGGSLR